MVLNAFHETWSLRLARLRQQVIERPDGPTWLWGIRIRILEFLLSSHGDAKGHGDWSNDQSGASRENLDVAGDLSAPSLPASTRFTQQWFGVTHPPRSRTRMLPMLRDIEDVAEEVRTQRGILSPGTAWEWWRSHWAC